MTLVITVKDIIALSMMAISLIIIFGVYGPIFIRELIREIKRRRKRRR